MRRLLVVVCAVVSVVGLAVSSGAFTSVQADQGVSVEVVGDGNAYMALDYPEQTVERSGTVDETVTLPVVNVTNQFTEGVDITVNYSVTGPSGTESGDSGPTALAVGETTRVSTEVTCPSDSGEYAVSVDFDATADGSGVFVETSDRRTVEYRVDCN